MRMSHSRAQAQHQQQMAMMMLQQNELADKNSFAASRHFDKWAQRYGDEVERRHQELLQGSGGMPPQFVPREALLNVIIGEKARAPSRQERRAQEANQRRASKQNVRAPNNRGDAGGGRGQQGKQLTEAQSRAKRLENVFI
jgi:hypothetical protein